MIPKKIHYCWLSGESMPKNILKCMKTWRDIMPGYELVLWDKNKFDINSVPFVAEACSVKKWAFAADYIRLYALYIEGGIYLDTDVVIKKDFAEFLKYDFFTSMEYHKEVKNNENAADKIWRNQLLKFPVQRCLLQAAIMGAAAGHPYIKDCLDWYSGRRFILESGKYHTHLLAPDIYTIAAIKYGFQNKDELQMLNNNMAVLPSWYFASNIAQYTKEAYALHWCESGWLNKLSFRKMYSDLASVNILRRLLNKKPLSVKTIDDVINDKD